MSKGRLSRITHAVLRLSPEWPQDLVQNPRFARLEQFNRQNIPLCFEMQLEGIIIISFRTS